ncbi:NAD(P)-binding Rossmann-fold superfamily protein [Zea mays]|uniref:NAD(P)-binding Rossmann-fold superfamily protein n=2 Tax=Zea mays TaxID=4577 RepID=A0A1D6GYM3_MAIZE|nr:NAD(P)-binding Rossmann-fold superfamily protein [Zea mays]
MDDTTKVVRHKGTAGEPCRTRTRTRTQRRQRSCADRHLNSRPNPHAGRCTEQQPPVLLSAAYHTRHASPPVYMAGELRHRRAPSEDEGVASSQRLDSAPAGNGKAGTSSGGGEGAEPRGGKRDALGWLEWCRGWMAIVGEFLFQRIAASHLANPLELPPLDGVSIVVTGATSGIGLEIARQLALAGAHVVMAVRRPKVAQELIQKWQNENSETGRPLNAEVMELDLLSLDSVVKFADAWNARMAPLHVLINNAGIFAIGEPQHFSKDGHEEHMQVNHLAPALLAMLLIPSLLRGSPSRIVNVNSIMHSVGFVDAEDFNLRKHKYRSWLAYSNSKLAQVKFSSMLHKRIPAEAGISIICASPGIVDTNVTRDLPKIVVAAYRFLPYFIFDGQEGSRSALFAACDPQVPEYCEMLKSEDWPVCACINYDCNPMNASEEAHSLETSQLVWEKTLEMIGLPPDALDKLIAGETVPCRYGQ